MGVERCRVKTLVLGWGNPILGDDGVGWHVAEAIEKELHQLEIIVKQSSASGFNLLDLMVGYDRVVIIDAIQTRVGKPGQVYRLELTGLDFPQQASFLHQVNLAVALEVGKKMGLALPQQVVIFAVEAADVTTFSEKCTPEVEQAIPQVVQMVLREVEG